MSSPIRTASRLLLMALAALWMMPSQAAQLVRIGAAHFPPYTVRPESGADTGLLPQLVEALNALQNDYQFVLVPTSIPRRFGDFKQGRVDMAIFENPDWGWKDIPTPVSTWAWKTPRFLSRSASMKVSQCASKTTLPT